MNVKELKSKKMFKEFLIKIPYNDVSNSIDQKIKEIIPTITLPGFRKGKAPLNIVKKKYENNILSEVIEKIIKDNTKKLLEEKKLQPLRQPKVEITKYKKDQPVELNLKIDLQPKLDLVDFTKIKTIKAEVKGILPSVYFIHGDFTDEEMNQMYNHPKVKAHISFTHGEGFGRPLLEAAQSGKPVIAPGWSGQADFLNPNYSVLLSGSLGKVPKNSFPKEIYFEDSQWFQVNYRHASQIMKDVVKNYIKHLVKSKQLQVYTKSLFSYEKMKEKLDRIITPLIESVPQQVELKLPKLQKIGEITEKGKLKLPALKKV